MKAIELFELYRDEIIDEKRIEIRVNNYTQKTVKYNNVEALKKEELLQHKVIDWFIGNPVTDGEIIINVEE